MGVAVYVHIPFCRQKCNYCDFASYPVAGLQVDNYLAALGKEIALHSASLEGKTVATLFVGGGTPSLLNCLQLRQLFNNITDNLVLKPGAEVTLEANPGTVDLEKLKLLQALGVNRLSIGIQSLDDAILKRLGRIHSAREGIEAYNLARKAGFENINLDLINGIPGQDFSSWEATLHRAVGLRPEHLAVYGLIIEEGTPFGRDWEQGLLQLPEEESRADMAVWTAEFLQTQGYRHYEISNFALPGKESRHNQVYWKNQPYLGFGSGAASYFHGVRRSNEPGVAKYIEFIEVQGEATVERETPDVEGEMAETMFLGLRLLEGISRESFAARFGIKLDEVYGAQIRRLVAKGLLVDTGVGIRLSQNGVLLANEVFCEFIP